MVGRGEVCATVAQIIGLTHLRNPESTTVYSQKSFQYRIPKVSEQSEAAFLCTCPEDKRIRSESLSNCDVATAP